MNNFLHKSKSLFFESISECSLWLNKQGFRISPASVEKDYWVCLFLSEFSKTPYSKDIIFGGGTALLKAHHLINRFSEDVDFCSLNTGKTKTQQEKFTWLAFDTLKSIVEDIFSLSTNDFKQTRSHCFMNINYSSVCEEQTGLKKHLEMEVLVSPLRYTDNVTEQAKVQSFVGEFLEKIDRKDLSVQFNLVPISILVVKPEYTLIDKIIRISRLGTEDEYVLKISNCARDIYDITTIMRDKKYENFLRGESFFDYAMKKIEDDNKRYSILTPDVLSQSKIFTQTKDILNSITFLNACKSMQEHLLFKPMDLPTGENFIQTFSIIANAIKNLAIKQKAGQCNI
ncbi:MAG: nucleotidyl transferase AbiEii/AbiGii toxin family protein [Bacteroidales bacterium]|jgi:predicted nucleotidyltransferase component of viral defense system|nr:nucleotidyl transferase AbiEii/AbiGii toxin family protein [Bacteroidales bacterium]